MVDDTVQVNRMIFVATLVGMVLLTVAVVVGINTLRSNHADDGVTRRVKLQACQAVENEIARTVCINGWG